ncbi:hypothetical protein, partial [Curtobacterium pusillum]|uniref:hypothetical protein n=1 Tax=Curtobacterium pusillum TaxID=69373 RepID=UPI00119D9822
MKSDLTVSSYSTASQARANATQFTIPAAGQRGQFQIAGTSSCIADGGSYNAVISTCSTSAASQKWEVLNTGEIFKAGSYAPLRVNTAGTRLVVNDGQMSKLVPLFDGVVRAGSVDVAGRTATLEGYAEPNADIIINDTIPAKANAEGKWSKELTGLKLGKQTVKVEQFLNNERVGDPIQVEVDLAVAPLTASAVFSSDPSVPVLVSGSGQANADVVVHRPGKPDTIQPIGTTGTYSFRMPAPDQGGEYTITLGQRFDKPGGGFEETTPVTLPIDYGRGVSIVSPAPDAEHAGGKVEMTGRGTPGALVTVTEKGSSKELGTARVLANDVWSLETTESLDAGKHTLVASQLSKGNNTTLAEVTLNPGASSVAPLVIASPMDGSTVESSSKRITFSGTGEPGARVQVKTQTASPRTIIDTYVGADGKWSQLGGDLNFGVGYVLDTIYTPQGGEAVRGTTRVTVTDSNPGVVQPF